MMTKYNSAEYIVDIPNRGKEVFKELREFTIDKDRIDFLNKHNISNENIIPTQRQKHYKDMEL